MQKIERLNYSVGRFVSEKSRHSVSPSERFQSCQKFKREFNLGMYRSRVEGTLVAVERQHIAFMQRYLSERDGACAFVKLQFRAADETDLAQLSRHDVGIHHQQMQAVRAVTMATGELFQLFVTCLLYTSRCV